MTTARTTTSASHLSLAKKGLKQKSASLPRRRDRSNTKPSLEGVKVSRSSSSHHHHHRRDETTGKSNTNEQRRRVLFLGMTTVVLSSAEKAKAFTVGGENLPSGSMFPSSNESFFTEDEEEERYTTKDLVLDFVSPIVALRVVNIAFNGGMGGSPKWLDYLCVASVGVVLWVFATDYSGLDAALH